MLVAALAAAIALPLATPRNMLVLYVEASAAFWAAAAVAWYVFGGIGRYYLLGSGAFLGTGAYVMALLNNAGFGPPVYGPAAIAATIVIALIISPLLRLSELFFALATLVIPLILGGLANYFVLHEVPLNGAAASLNVVTLYYLLLGVVCLYLAVAWSVDKSVLGLRMRTLSESEITAAAAGIHPVRTKLQALLIVAPLLGLLGAFYPILAQVVSSSDAFGPEVTLRPFVTSIVGGLGSPFGGILGAMILVPLSDILNHLLASRFAGLNLLVYGLALVAIAVALPDGLFGLLASMFRRAVPNVPVTSVLAAGDPPPLSWLRAQQGTSPNLEIAGLSVNYGGVRALDGVSFAARGGELIGIIGPNGSGKTTLINAMSGAVAAMSLAGTISVGGREITRQSMFARAQRGIWRSFQHPTAMTRVTLAENVALGLMNRGLSRSDALRHANNVIAAIEAEWGRSIDSSTLFGVKLAEVLRVLCSGAGLVMLDEPLAGLSEQECRILLVLISRSMTDGRIVLVVDHNVRFLSEVCHRIVALDLGRVIADGTPSAVTRDERVVSSYLGAEAA